VTLTREQERELCLRWERETGKCSACGHALSMHNELAYCRAKTSHDRSGPCVCGLPNAENRRLHMTAASSPAAPEEDGDD
jgi:hypothetical protein